MTDENPCLFTARPLDGGSGPSAITGTYCMKHHCWVGLGGCPGASPVDQRVEARLAALDARIASLEEFIRVHVPISVTTTYGRK